MKTNPHTGECCKRCWIDNGGGRGFCQFSHCECHTPTKQGGVEGVVEKFIRLPAEKSDDAIFMRDFLRFHLNSLLEEIAVESEALKKEKDNKHDTMRIRENKGIDTVVQIIRSKKSV